MKSPILRNAFKKLTLAFSGWELSGQGIINNKQGEWWLIGQVLLILAHLFPCSPPTIAFGFLWPKIFAYSGIVIFCIGIYLTCKSFLSLGINLSPLPKPKPGANLVIGGSYKHCRHPLYQAILICSFGYTLILGSLVHLFIFAGLCTVLIGKAKKEEKQLLIRHKSYQNYLKGTPAIIKNLPLFDWRA